MALEGSWYKGDLHSHSIHSDGDSPVDVVVKKAESLGFDFFALTDHDGNMNGSPTHWYDPAYSSDSVTLLYGIEWTTGLGHANVWAAAPFDYAPLWEAHKNQDVDAAVKAAHKARALFSINHPTAYACCPWDYPIVEGIDSMEVWNAMYRIPNLNGLAVNMIWDDVLLSGRRLSCVGGSDTHQHSGPQSLLFSLGNPTTWVFAKKKTGNAILRGIKAGRTTISYAPDGPLLTLSADLDSDGVFETQIGDNITGETADTVFKVDVSAQSGKSESGTSHALDSDGMDDLLLGKLLPRLDLVGDPRILTVVKNGEIFKAWIVTGTSFSVTFHDTPGDLDYYRAVLYGKLDLDRSLQKILYARLLAMTGPIYSGFHSDDARGDMTMYFGNLHSHSAVSDGQGTPEEAFAWARDEAGYDFYAISDHAEQIRPDEWNEIGEKADAFNEDGRFVAMRGFEWSHPSAGHINVFNTDAYTSSIQSPSLRVFYRWLDRQNGLAQFNHPGREPLTFHDFDYSSSVADNIFAIETGNKGTGNNDGEYLAYYPDALSAGWHVAPTNNQDNHSLSTNSHRTVLIAPELTRSALLYAMKNRRIYSTDDPNINVVFKLGKAWMGSVVNTSKVTARFTVDIADDEPINKIELLNEAGIVLAEKIPGVSTDSIHWRPAIPALPGSYYIQITSENVYDNADDEAVQVTMTAPIIIN
jgi:predicted metal-dependent phosphoesterase TrpH